MMAKFSGWPAVVVKKLWKPNASSLLAAHMTMLPSVTEIPSAR